MYKFVVSIAVACACAALVGCASEAEVAGPESQNAPADEAGGESVDETSAAIQLHDYNGVCAQSLSLRATPGGVDACNGREMGRKNATYVYDIDGAWAYIRVLSGPCESRVGWALKDYLSRNCL